MTPKPFRLGVTFVLFGAREQHIRDAETWGG
ncbi:hypothetical protein BJ972_002018 [Agromyces atrinae]|uniref:Uncharacterized protein n=1 Tax=Agromyces atrinae TaxID=592376 RepID=A0A852SJT8_9MICO|nr:hypothetical protein [Agromyces atrinae]